MSDEIAYADAIRELETIVAGLEQADVDVDALAERVARAAELIKLCRDRIDRTRLEVERIVGDLGDPPG
jgi:exodeoxyribonuclease VII small subunit